MVGEEEGRLSLGLLLQCGRVGADTGVHVGEGCLG
jgi:hypothetical protein